MTTPERVSVSRNEPSVERDRQALEAFLPDLPDDWSGWVADPAGNDDDAALARFRPSADEARTILLVDELAGHTYRRSVSDMIDHSRVVLAEVETTEGVFDRHEHVARIVVVNATEELYLFALWVTGASNTLVIDGADVWRPGMDEPVGWSDSPAMLRSWLRDDHDDPDSEIQQCLTWVDDEQEEAHDLDEREDVDNRGNAAAEVATDGPSWTDDHLARGRRLIVDLDGAQWSLGDLAVEVFGFAPEQGAHDTRRPALDRFAEDIGVPADRLAEYRMVASRWEVDERLEGIGWTLHRDTRNREHRVRDLMGFLAHCKTEQVAPTRARLREYLRELDGPTPRRAVTADAVRRHASTLLAELGQLRELDPDTLATLDELRRRLSERLGQSQ